MSSNPASLVLRSVPSPITRGLAHGILAGALCVMAVHVAAQDDAPITNEPTTALSQENTAIPDEVAAPQEAEERVRIDLSVTVPRGEVNAAQAQECDDRADAGSISGEIIVCRRLGEKGENYFSGSREEARKRYARETAFKGDPQAPGLFGIPDNGKGIGFGGVPPPALIIDVGALPDAPPGSDADRIARGLPPLGQDEDLSEEDIRKRREALGLPPPAFEKKKP